MSVSMSGACRATASAAQRTSPVTMACDDFTMARMRGPGKWSQRIALAIALLPAGAAAAGRVSVTAGHADFAGLQVEALEASWAPSAGANGAVRFRAARIRGIAETGPL